MNCLNKTGVNVKRAFLTKSRLDEKDACLNGHISISKMRRQNLSN
jgi:hypothetical protein